MADCDTGIRYQYQLGGGTGLSRHERTGVMCRRKMSGCSVANRTSWANLPRFWRDSPGLGRILVSRPLLHLCRKPPDWACGPGREPERLLFRCKSTGFHFACDNEMTDPHFAFCRLQADFTECLRILFEGGGGRVVNLDFQFPVVPSNVQIGSLLTPLLEVHLCRQPIKNQQRLFSGGL